MFASFFYWMAKYCNIGKVAYLQYFEFVPIVGTHGHFLLMYEAQKLYACIIIKHLYLFSYIFIVSSQFWLLGVTNVYAFKPIRSV
jgi:hypothetical protein